MESWGQVVVTVFASLLASQGLWAFLQRRDTRKGAQTQLLLGLAHDRIIHLGMKYIQRGWVSKDEFEDYIHYFCEPYSEFGGNGMAEKVMRDVKNLPIKNVTPTTAQLDIIRKEPEDD